MTFAEKMKTQAKTAQKRLVLAEGSEERTIKAARIIADEGLAREVILVGSKAEIERVANASATSLEGLSVVDPQTSDNLKHYAHEFYELRKHKGMTEEQALVDITNPLRFGAM